MIVGSNYIPITTNNKNIDKLKQNNLYCSQMFCAENENKSEKSININLFPNQDNHKTIKFRPVLAFFFAVPAGICAGTAYKAGYLAKTLFGLITSGLVFGLCYIQSKFNHRHTLLEVKKVQSTTKL